MSRFSIVGLFLLVGCVVDTEDFVLCESNAEATCEVNECRPGQDFVNAGVFEDAETCDAIRAGYYSFKAETGRPPEDGCELWEHLTQGGDYEPSHCKE